MGYGRLIRPGERRQQRRAHHGIEEEATDGCRHRAHRITSYHRLALTVRNGIDCAMVRSTAAAVFRSLVAISPNQWVAAPRIPLKGRFQAANRSAQGRYVELSIAAPMCRSQLCVGRRTDSVRARHGAADGKPANGLLHIVSASECGAGYLNAEADLAMKKKALALPKAPVTKIGPPLRAPDALMTFPQTPELCKASPAPVALFGRAGADASKQPTHS